MSTSSTPLLGALEGAVTLHIYSPGCESCDDLELSVNAEMLHIDMEMLHVDIEMLHVNIAMLHVDIEMCAC